VLDGTTALSEWSAGVAFTTTDCPVNTCPVPTNLTTTNISQTGAVLQWNGVTGIGAYTIRYKPVNSTLPYNTVISTSNMIQINGLTAGVTYVWQVAAVCPNTTTMASWSPQSVFTTRSSLVAYPNPGNETVSISVWSDKATTVEIKLLDFYGKEIISQKREAVEGVNVFGVNTSEVSEGLYLIGFYSDSVLTTTKVVIKH